MEKGTFFNWSSIEAAFNSNSLAVATIEHKTVGFYALSKRYPSGTIDLAEVHPEFRNRKIAARILEVVIEELQKQDFRALDLMCAPPSSEIIWRKMGFTDMPRQQDINQTKLLCYIFGEHLQSTTHRFAHETLEIWDDEPYRTKDGLPKWIYNLAFENGTRELQKPIVLYADYDWRVRWTVGNNVIRDCKLKYLLKDMVFGNCLFIDKLPSTV